MASFQDCVSEAAADGASLGSFIDSLASVKPHTIELSDTPRVMQTYGDGVVVGLDDGKVLLVCVGPTPTCYCLESDTPHTDAVIRLAVSRGGDMCLSGDSCGIVKLWNLTERKELATLCRHSEAVRALLITSNGLLGVVIEDKLIKVWDLQAKRELFTLEGHTSSIKCLELSTNNRFLYSGDDKGTIKVWDFEERKEISTFSVTPYGYMRLTLYSEDKLLYFGLSYDGEVCFWNVANMKEIAALPCQLEYICVSLVQKGQICLSATDKETIIWNLSTNREIAHLKGHTSDILNITVFTSEHFCLTGSYDHTIRLWNLETYEEEAVFQGHEQVVVRVNLTENNQHFISGSEDKTLKIWSLARKIESQVIKANLIISNPLANTPDLAIVAEGPKIKLWRWKDCQEVGELKVSDDSIRMLTVTSDLKTVISADANNNIRLWNLKTMTLEHTFPEHESVQFLAVTPDGRRFITVDCRNSALILWSLEEKRVLGRVAVSDDVAAVVIEPSGECVVIGTYEGKISIWSLPELKCIGEFLVCKPLLIDLAFTPDGQTLGFCGTDATINLWDFKERRTFASFYGHTGIVRSMNVSPDGRYVASGSDDKTVRVWSMEEKREVACYPQTNELGSVCFSHDGQNILFELGDGRVHLISFIVPWECTGTSPFEATSVTAAIIASLISGKRVSKAASNWIISPYRINSLHISAYYNHAERAQEYLAAGVPFLKGTFGSPLTVALQRKTIKCVEVFLNYLISIASATKNDLEWPAFACIMEDIPVLLRCGSALLQPFFEVLMQVPAVPVLPYFITPKWNLPVVVLSENRLLNISDFDISSKGEMGSELVKFYISLIKQNLTPGSAPSLELVEALQDCEDKTVLNTPYISTIIEEKWAYFYPFTLTFTLLYTTMVASLVLLLFNVWDTTLLASAFIAINAFFVVYEMAQMVVDKWAYWMDPWNYVDIFRVFLSLFWGTLILVGQEQSFLLEYQRYIRLSLALLCLLRGFTYFRSFRTTRVFVYMTLAVIKEIYSFLFIMAYSVFAFGVCTSVLCGHTTLGESWTSAFSLVLGDFDSSTFGFMEWTIFSCAAIINVVIMLNLLVSILGDAYGMTQMSVRENDLYMMLDLVNEYESLMFWRRSAGTPVVMFTCDTAIESESAADWAGQVSKITEKVKDEVGKSTETIQGRVEALKGAQEKSTEALEKKMEAQKTELKEVVEKKMQAMEEKLEAILVLLKNRS